MAYPPPPGTSSLPPRPPANAGGINKAARSGFKPSFSTTSTAPGHAYSSGPTYNAGASRYPGAPTASQYGQPTYSSGYAGAPSAPVSGAGRGYGYPSAAQQGYGPQSHSHGPPSYSAAPQIRNPFPTPGHQAAVVSNPSDYDPDMAAQVAQWQSAYSSEATPVVDKNGKPVAPTVPKPEVPATAVPGQPDKKKTVVRQGGGKKWTDDTLLEWDPAHLRLFVGNLAGETTDDSLLKAFAPWKSVQKARVIRDRRTNKSKGYGFVSFSDADDFFNAAKTMNGQYIQSHPVIVRKANTEIKATNVKEKRNGKNNRNNWKKSGNQQGAGSNADGGGTYGTYEPALGPVAPTGVTKPGQRTKNGLRLLG
ncbi:RNP domain protein [Metarhizium album ARSEF 1941]|uniref:RNP domain protein n=1 Tax=Metarhizium album (strain ARSEF 1941) TaxID=1081103 RepID=A0A0B2WN14_METAS|nr:RNP domain protein [Metarhizium album ARSEF 1941]KHN95303.1 RNP domain protein [Metarhizium album ARSEF 1941]